MNITPEYLSEEVRQLCERWPDTPVVGIHATRWQGGGSIVIGDVTFRVSWCESALSVSEELAVLGGGERLIVLTPLEDADLGLDVLARLARRRLIRPERWQMVRDAYGVTSVDPRLPAYAWMADALLAARPGKRTTPANALDAATAWRYVLGHFLGLPDGSPDADAILRWSMEPGAADRFAALPEPLAEAVRQRLGETAGGLGTLLAQGIAAGHTSELLAMGLACGTLFGEANPASEAAPSGPADLMEPALAQAAARLEPRLGGTAVEPDHGRAWGAAARRIVRAEPRDRRGEWLGRAESLLASLKAEDFAERSTVLPSGFRRRLGHFATQAAAAIEGPGALASAEEAFRRVREHIAGEDDRERIRRLEMALRLVRALHARLRQPPRARRRDAARDPAGMAARHAREGAFEDWARRHLLGGDEDVAVGTLFGTLHRAVRAHRETLNRAFAECVRAWVAGGADDPGSGAAVPIERCLARTVVPIAKSRPVLVLVLDGMDAGIFEELGESLRERGWRRQRGGGVPEAALAVLPTVTEASRMALLSGEVKRGGAAAEKTAFARHPDLLGVCRSRWPPILFHKADLTGDAAQGLAASVRKALGDERRRVVGIVLNAVDDHLAKSEQLQLAWGFDSIRLLPAILMEAHAAGRAVVLTSDHGHVLEADSVKLPGDGEGRWRHAASPAADSSVTEWEIALEGPRVRAATARERIVLPWSETVRYGLKRNGYHGGLTLQEVVVPVGVYVGPGEVLDGWEPAPPPYPPWWSAEESEPTPFHLPAPAPDPIGTKASANPQPDLFAESALARTAAAARWDPLFESGMYAAQRRLAGREAPDDAMVRTALDALFEARGRLPIASFAERLGVTAPRTRRVIAGLQRLLNVDGHPVLRLDGERERIELDGGLLVRRFELEG